MRANRPRALEHGTRPLGMYGARQRGGKQGCCCRRWPDRTTARAEIFTFIETFYNRKRLRRHPVWGYLAPLEIRQRHEQEHALAA
ncbi:hypothetical protein [Streptomyces sp. QTS137]